MLRSPLSSPLRSPLSSPLAVRRGGGAWSIGSAISTSKVDFVGIGDSNLLFGGHGWDEGVQWGLAQSYPMYATGLVSVAENSGSGAGTGLNGSWSRRGGSIAPLTFTGAPSELAALMPSPPAMYPHNYGHIAGTDTITTTSTGIIISTGSVLDQSSSIRFDLWCGGLNSGSGAVNLSIRMNQSPWTTLTTSSAVSTNTGALGVPHRVSTTLAAASRAHGLECLIANGGRTLTGPFFGTYMRAVNTDRASGWAWSNLSARGGEPLRTHAVSLQGTADTAITHFFQVVRDGQSDQPNKRVVMWVNSGLNERNETSGLTSVGPNPTTGGTTAAFIDNFEAIRLRVESVWAANGWPLSELQWVASVSHPVSNPDDSKLIDYRAALSAHAATIPRCTVVDISALTNEAEMLSSSWYNTGGSDRNHLTIAGYQQIGGRIVGAMT
jgi:hypothetical protein